MFGREGQDNGDEVGRARPSSDSEGVRKITEHDIKGDMSQFHASIQSLPHTGHTHVL